MRVGSEGLDVTATKSALTTALSRSVACLLDFSVRSPRTLSRELQEQLAEMKVPEILWPQANIITYASPMIRNMAATSACLVFQGPPTAGSVKIWDLATSPC
ncbi:hypothetical protein PLESTF_001606900 [Pleodorina starrii]|nr:hypothetical protein PLESTF_001606900 [Pleodorina starrii]